MADIKLFNVTLTFFINQFWIKEGNGIFQHNSVVGKVLTDQNSRFQCVMRSLYETVDSRQPYIFENQDYIHITVCVLFE